MRKWPTVKRNTGSILPESTTRPSSWLDTGRADGCPPGAARWGLSQHDADLLMGCHTVPNVHDHPCGQKGRHRCPRPSSGGGSRNGSKDTMGRRRTGWAGWDARNGRPCPAGHDRTRQEAWDGFHSSHNPEVVGSNPTPATTGRPSERFPGAVFMGRVSRPVTGPVTGLNRFRSFLLALPEWLQDTSAHEAPGRSSSNLRRCSAVARTSRSQRCA